MKQLKFNAHYSNGHDWSFCVREIESGLILPILRENWSISLIDGCIVLDCEISKKLPDDMYLPIRVDGLRLVSDGNGYIETLVPFYTEDNGSRIICAIKLEGFSDEKR